MEGTGCPVHTTEMLRFPKAVEELGSCCGRAHSSFICGAKPPPSATARTARTSLRGAITKPMFAPRNTSAMVPSDPEFLSLDASLLLLKGAALCGEEWATGTSARNGTELGTQLLHKLHAGVRRLNPVQAPHCDTAEVPRYKPNCWTHQSQDKRGGNTHSPPAPTIRRKCLIE